MEEHTRFIGEPKKSHARGTTMRTLMQQSLKQTREK
jgi:hypothetical protein